MSRRPGFGYIYIVDKEGDDRLVRLGSLDIDYVKDQYGPEAKNCHIREDSGFCQSSWTAGEPAGAILAKISEHDKEYVHFVRDFAQRNHIVLMKGELW